MHRCVGFPHRKRQGEGHILRKATVEETEEFTRNWWRAKVETLAQRSARLDERRRQQRDAKAAQGVPPESSEPLEEYRLDFGKFKGKTPLEVHKK